MNMNPMMNNNTMNMGMNPMMNNNMMNMNMNPNMNNNTMNMGMNPVMNNNMNMNMNMNPNMNNNTMNMGMNPVMNNNMNMNMMLNPMVINTKVMGQMLMANMINQVNQNFIRINNEMAKLAQQKMENKQVQNNNNNQNSNNGELPRAQENVYYDPFAGYNGPRINVKCITPAGHTVMMNAPTDATVYSLLYKYIQKIQLGPNVINNAIYFISNGKKIKNEELNKKVGELFTDNTNIIVIDQKGLIGG